MVRAKSNVWRLDSPTCSLGSRLVDTAQSPAEIRDATECTKVVLRSLRSKQSLIHFSSRLGLKMKCSKSYSRLRVGPRWSRLAVAQWPF